MYKMPEHFKCTPNDITPLVSLKKSDTLSFADRLYFDNKWSTHVHDELESHYEHCLESVSGISTWWWWIMLREFQTINQISKDAMEVFPDDKDLQTIEWISNFIQSFQSKVFTSFNERILKDIGIELSELFVKWSAEGIMSKCWMISWSRSAVYCGGSNLIFMYPEQIIRMFKKYKLNWKAALKAIITHEISHHIQKNFLRDAVQPVDIGKGKVWSPFFDKFMEYFHGEISRRWTIKHTKSWDKITLDNMKKEMKEVAGMLYYWSRKDSEVIIVRRHIELWADRLTWNHIKNYDNPMEKTGYFVEIRETLMAMWDDTILWEKYRRDKDTHWTWSERVAAFHWEDEGIPIIMNLLLKRNPKWSMTITSDHKEAKSMQYATVEKQEDRKINEDWNKSYAEYVERWN